jgi:hypothetical protein
MANTYYEADDFYVLKSEINEIKLFVQFGETCCGGYLIFFDGNLVNANSPAMIECKEMLGKWITVNVVMRDDQHKFDWASVLITLQEDSSIPKMLGPYRKRMEEGNDSICFTIKINIVDKSPIS